MREDPGERRPPQARRLRRTVGRHLPCRQATLTEQVKVPRRPGGLCALRSDSLDNAEANSDPGSFTKQNERMLKVHFSAASGTFYAKQGSMVAHQRNVEIAFEGSGGMGKMFKKARTSEGMSLMKVSGGGDVFLADQADDVCLIHLENESVTVGGDHVLAFESSLNCDINKLGGASMMTGGALSTTFTEPEPSLAPCSAHQSLWTSTCRPS
jgi:hypothetical protein